MSLIVSLFVASVATMAVQQRTPEPDQDLAAPSSARSASGGSAAAGASQTQTADTGSGRIGQRQTREEAASNVEPLRRLQNRVANRIQNRIRNRLDRTYDPQANVDAPFATASDQARTPVR